MPKDRWQTMNDLVDEWLPHLTASESRLLWFYFRHAVVRGSGGRKRNVCSLGDRLSSKRLGITRESVRRTRMQLISKGVLEVYERANGKKVWLITPVVRQERGGSAALLYRERSATR